MFNGIYDPYGFYNNINNANNMNIPNTVPQPREQHVVKVNGENGARAYPIGANSDALLLDESGRMIWLVTTDGAGYKSAFPYDINPHQQPVAPDYSEFDTRLSRLEADMEALINELTSTNTSTTTKQNSNNNSYSKSNSK